jgi:protein-serine/threonine kinase
MSSISRPVLMIDPAWADPIKQLVRTRAKEQQARAVAQVVEATAKSRMLGMGNFP